MLTKNISYFNLQEAQIIKVSTQETGLQKATYPLVRRLRKVGDRFALSLFSGLPPTEAGLTTGVILGGNQHFSSQFREKVRQSGLLHLTAVSGYNITILIGLATAMLRLLGNRYLVIPGVIASIIFFTLITGGGASVIRAAIMGAMGFLALQAGSQRSTGRIFALTASLMLIFKPAWFWDIGWRLSAAATASLIWLQPVIYKLLCHSEAPLLSLRTSLTSVAIWFHWLRVATAPQRRLAMTNTNPRNDEQKSKNPFLESLSASLSAYLATLPLLIWHFGWNNISWVGVLNNIPAAVLVPWIMAAGALIGFAGILSLPAARLLAVLTRPSVWALVKIIELGSWLNLTFTNYANF